MKGLLDFLQAASNGVASNVSGPVDLIGAGLNKIGLNVGAAPVGGSEWMKRQGLMRDVEPGAAKVLGETAGLLGPAMVSHFAPQIAKGLLQVEANAMAPAKLNKESGKLLVGPRSEAMDTAQKNATEMLGLPPNNTAADRAKALGFDTDAVHFSRHGVDVNVLDSGKYANAPFDAVGTHVGSKEAALDRFRNTVATTDQIKGSTYPLLIKRGDEFVSPSGGAWQEDALNQALLERGGYATARETYPALNEKLRRDIFRGSGYDSIPYVNDVEAVGKVSHIVPPHNIRSRFAAFDPARIKESDLLGMADPRLLGLLGAGVGGGAYLASDK